MKREDVEALYQEARENGGSIGHVDSTHLAALRDHDQEGE